MRRRMRKMEERIQVRAKDETGVEFLKSPEEMIEELKRKMVELEAECQRWQRKYERLRKLIEETYQQFI